jgi:lipopolysaccharide/colanic/teichoic acid biosynthesis glycosyltransferase
VAGEGKRWDPSIDRSRIDIGTGTSNGPWLTSQRAPAERLPVGRRTGRAPDIEPGGDHVDLTGPDPAVRINLARARMLAPTSGLLTAPRWKLAVKRAVDVIGSIVAIALAMPILVVSTLLIAATSPGGVLFRQTRLGKDGRPFRLWKLRSMVADAESRLDDIHSLNEKDGPVFKIKDDPRITPVGRFLRRLSIDELPQLVQVLTGRMSLVGVRPALPSEALEYDDRTRQRLLVKPGITCIWQTSGRSDLSFEEWVRMDLEYISSWSLWLDVKLLMKTIPAVFSGKGAY